MAGDRRDRWDWRDELFSSRQNPRACFDRKDQKSTGSEAGKRADRMPGASLQPQGQTDARLATTANGIGLGLHTAHTFVETHRSTLVLHLSVNAAPVLTAPLAECFGRGEPGWLVRDVPGDTMFNFADGRVVGPTFVLIRSAASGRWAHAGTEWLSAP